MDTLAVQLTLPLAGCVEVLHLLVSAPCRAHKCKVYRLPAEFRRLSSTYTLESFNYESGCLAAVIEKVL